MKRNNSESRKKLQGENFETSDSALLIIDMINHFDFPGGKILAKRALPVAKKIALFKEELHEKKIPTIYANDNFGKWKSDFRYLVSHCEALPGIPGEIARLLAPKEDDYFVLKPKHSAFFSTPLDLLLKCLETKKVIMTGLTGSQCVPFTAKDAKMREFEIFTPTDCIVSFGREEERHVEFLLKKGIGARTTRSRGVSRYL